MPNKSSNQSKSSNPQTGDLLANVLAGSWRPTPPPLELSLDALESITPQLLSSGAGALAWWRLRNSQLSTTPPALQLQQVYRHYSLQAVLHERAIQQLFTQLREVEVEPILIKGWNNALHYAEKGLRPYGDIDLCIKDEQYQQSATLFGYPNTTKEVLSVSAAGARVELHRGFTDLDGADDVGAQTLFTRSGLTQLNQNRIRVLCQEDHLRLVCIHFLRHGAWRPLWLCDIAAAVETRPADFDWDRCLGQNPRRADWVACAIGLAHQLLGLPVDDTPVSERAKHLPRWLIPDVLKAWERPSGADHQTPVSIKKSFKPAQLTQVLQDRWFNPIEATIRLKGPFSEWPRLPWQIGMYFVRFGKFLGRGSDE